VKTLFQRFVQDQSGATAIEYGLIRPSSRSPRSAPWPRSAASSRPPSRASRTSWS